MKRILIFSLLGFVLGACSPSGKSSEIATEGKNTASEKAEADGQNTASTENEGEKIFKMYCSSCHQMSPPPKIAPPVLGIAAHYREAFKNKEEAVAHMVAFIQSPDSSKSKLEARALNRFGLMPTLPLSKEKLSMAAGWLWDQYDPNFKCGGGAGAGAGVRAGAGSK
ncbi:c-type cytochrome [Chloroherpeton thalassium]|nr:c-type cytochrome [Chloroherpeton thalassium]